MQVAINSLLDSWLAQHPLCLWLVTHPVISLIAALSGLILLRRLLAAIATLIDRIWIWILQSPILLIKSLLGLKTKSLQTDTAEVETDTEPITDSALLAQILAKLEAIEEQQQQIIEEIATIKQQSEAKILSSKN